MVGPPTACTGRSTAPGLDSSLPTENPVMTVLVRKAREFAARGAYPERGRAHRDDDARDQQDRVKDEPGEKQRNPERQHGQPDARRREMEGVEGFGVRRRLRLRHAPKLL